MPQKREQKTDISISADGDFGEMKKTKKTPSKSRRVGRYSIICLFQCNALDNSNGSLTVCQVVFLKCKESIQNLCLCH